MMILIIQLYELEKMVRRYIMNWIKMQNKMIIRQKSGIIDSWGSSYKKKDTVPEVNGKDALDAMKAIFFAALESSESGQTGRRLQEED